MYRKQRGTLHIRLNSSEIKGTDLRFVKVINGFYFLRTENIQM